MKLKTKVGTCAIIITVTAFFFILLAFVTPYWLVNNGKNENADSSNFQKLGLWEVCLDNFEDFRHHFDFKFTGCWWVFEEEYYIINDFLLPGFFIATQFFFTLCMTLVLVAAFLTWMFCFCSRDHDKYLLLLLSNGSNLILGGICGLISVLIFGFNGDGRDWMPHWQENDLGWSYGFACVGSLLLFLAGTLFFVEARRAKYRRLQSTASQSEYNIEPPKPGPYHTDI